MQAQATCTMIYWFFFKIKDHYNSAIERVYDFLGKPSLTQSVYFQNDHDQMVSLIPIYTNLSNSTETIIIAVGYNSKISYNNHHPNCTDSL